MLLVKFVEIPVEGLRVDVDDVLWFPDNELVRRGSPKATVFLERDGNRVWVTGNIEVFLVLTCDRCLSQFDRLSKVDFRLILEVADAGPPYIDHQRLESECTPDELEVVDLDRPEVDLGELLYQQVLLALPQKVVCRTDCRGLCCGCGSNLNTEMCGCSDSSMSPSFAALGALLKKNK